VLSIALLVLLRSSIRAKTRLASVLRPLPQHGPRQDD
jgi:hypothetical protein